MDYKIKKNDSGDRSFFYIEKENGDRIGEIHFEMRNNDRIVIQHTEVDQQYSGKGLGKDLVEHVVNYARDNNLKVIPVCSYARKLFDRNGEEWADVS